jgi:hypothetical protein
MDPGLRQIGEMLRPDGQGPLAPHFLNGGGHDEAKHSDSIDLASVRPDQRSKSSTWIPKLRRRSCPSEKWTKSVGEENGMRYLMSADLPSILRRPSAWLLMLTAFGIALGR